MKDKILPVLLLLSLAALTLSSTGDALAARELIVSAASSLTNAFGEIGKQFEEAHPGTKVTLNFGASGALLQQIDKGAPVDVFASADQKTMDQAREKSLILPDTRRNFVKNKLVLIMPGDARLPVKTLKDLTLKEVARISLGNPESAPVGRYAKEVLTNEGLWEVLEPKLIRGDSVRQVLDYVSRREVDAGFVFATDAAVAADRVKVVFTAETHEPILYPIAVVGTTQQKEAAQLFMDFVSSDRGQDILSRYGFERP